MAENRKVRDLEPEGLSVPEACLYSGIGRSKLYDLLKTGEIASITVGTRRLVLRTSLLDFMGSRPRSMGTCNAAVRHRYPGTHPHE